MYADVCKCSRRKTRLEKNTLSDMWRNVLVEVRKYRGDVSQQTRWSCLHTMRNK